MGFSRALCVKVRLWSFVLAAAWGGPSFVYAEEVRLPYRDVTITGAGSSFAAPVYEGWGTAAFSQTKVHVNYQAIGSGAGQDQVIAGTVDFGATDKPMGEVALKKAGLYQFPTVMSGVVVIVHLKSVPRNTLRLDGPVLAGIYAGMITDWNDSRIQALNPDIKLPDEEIVPIHRADGSGTSYVFTSYLSLVSPEWKNHIGAGTLVEWPGGAGARGNDGIAALVRQTEGSLGYVEFAYAEGNNLPVAKLKTHDGVFIEPNLESLAKAASSADWQESSGFTVSLLDQGGAGSWPIVSATYALVPLKAMKTAEGAGVRRFFQWGFEHGQEINSSLGYVGLPAKVQSAILVRWADK
ncbi:phosphate ABC transporter substrate-binding protein PstS [Acetobacteraceae bacterium ESL0709]|nr:phosphate ABC transporter substrate-binding protein PstS [Acetobacteraceae bacterium ESL0697]MDF7678948.1 phosphate ABC transporter substrate-binding protein PstS [Acetobacteraceae bacterium ESL0709]